MAAAAANAYSQTWFELFLRRIPPEQTRREADFLARHLPLPAYRNVLDICCGDGRHAAEMAQRGCAVTGVDRDAAAIARARANAPAARFLVGDMRYVAALRGPFDAVLCLWASFGYFDAATNAAVLRDVAALLRPGGRLVLDVYHRGFFESHEGERAFEVDGRRIVERRAATAGRLRVELRCEDDAVVDVFDWQIYSPDELIELAAGIGLAPVVTCSNFDETVAASDRVPRYQLILEVGNEERSAEPNLPHHSG